MQVLNLTSVSTKGVLLLVDSGSSYAKPQFTIDAYKKLFDTLLMMSNLDHLLFSSWEMQRCKIKPLYQSKLCAVDCHLAAAQELSWFATGEAALGL